MGNHSASYRSFPLQLSLYSRWGFNSWRLFSGGGNNNGSVPIEGIGDATEDNGDGDDVVELNVLHSEEATCPSDNNDRSSLWLWLSALWDLYVVWLKQSPLLIKAITSGVLAMSGDMAAQCFEFQQEKRSGPFRRVRMPSITVTLMFFPAVFTVDRSMVDHALGGEGYICGQG